MEHFNSQISGSSFSLISEPPDIANWFPSYEYESFVLDTCDNFGINVEKESEICKDWLDIQEINKEHGDSLDESTETSKSDEVGSSQEADRRDLKFSQISDSLRSSSALSEPPDIRNWYEPVAIDRSHDAASSILKESQCEKNAFVNGHGLKVEVENSSESQKARNKDELDLFENTCSSKLVERNGLFGVSKHEEPSLEKILVPNSPPLLFEPPDIRNWFSSYAYESPVLGTSDEFCYAHPKERKSEGDEFPTEESNRMETENSEKNRKAEVRDEEVTGEMDNHRAVSKENPAGLDRLCFEKILEQRLEVKSFPSSRISSCNKDFERSCLNSEGGFISLKSKCLGNIDNIENTFEAKLQTEVDLASSQHNLNYDPVSETSFRKPIQGSNNDTENVGKCAESGFITTRKNRCVRRNDENSAKLAQCLRKKGGNEITAGGEGGGGKRKVLVETTNIRNSGGLAVTGKWRCPQKTKPLRGPPLKQLRLEQWIHKQ